MHPKLPSSTQLSNSRKLRIIYGGLFHLAIICDIFSPHWMVVPLFFYSSFYTDYLLNTAKLNSHLFLNLRPSGGISKLLIWFNSIPFVITKLELSSLLKPKSHTFIELFFWQNKIFAGLRSRCIQFPNASTSYCTNFYK